MPIGAEQINYTCNADGFTVVCAKKIQAGEEIYITYGPLSNDALLTSYGFALEVNEEGSGYCPDEVTFIMPMPSDKFKLGLLEAAGYSLAKKTIQMQATCIRNVPELFGVLRTLLADESDLCKLRCLSSPPKSAHDVKSISLSNEFKVLYSMWRHASTGCTGLEQSTDMNANLAAFKNAIDICTSCMLDADIHWPKPHSKPDSHPPIIIKITEEALKRAGSIAKQSVAEHEEACRCLAAACARSDDSSQKCLQQSAWRAEMARRVVASDRRVFAHFCAIAVLGTAICGLSETCRASILPRIENASTLEGLRPSSRKAISKYIQGLCRYFGKDLSGPATLTTSNTIHATLDGGTKV